MLRGHRFFDYGGGGVFWQGAVAGFIGFWGGLLEAQRAMRTGMGYLGHEGGTLRDLAASLNVFH